MPHRPTLATAAEIDEALAALPGWRAENGRLVRTFEFPTFAEAFAFMTAAALVAERLDHHPDWSNSWRRVDVSLTTHDRGGVTALDLELARAMSRLAAGRESDD
ncbi:MAG: 4a-hydroxytetrahydrobiopterin dehydratase [Deltaproteobacteria bacterium]|nr:4a-hydroxytetrahydrobiopterin dehydratase [Deltaproteobacteria bacterium]